MEFVEYLKQQIGDKSLGYIETVTGIGKSHLSRILRGQYSTPKPDTLKKLAPALPCSYEELMEAAGYIKPNKPIRVPVLGRIPAGIPIEAIEEIVDYEEITPELANKGKLFALSVEGNSMAPKIESGDVVIIKQQEDCENNQVAVVMVNGYDATLKMVRKDSTGITLLGYNPSFTPQYYSNKQIEELPVRILGVLVELRRSF